MVSSTSTLATALTLVFTAMTHARATPSARLLTVPATTTEAFNSYDNDFILPGPILDRYLNKDGSTNGSDTGAAEESILNWADFLNVQGPWSES